MADRAQGALGERIESYWTLPAQALLQRLRSSRQGLSGSEASARLEQCGRNVLTRRRRVSRWRVLGHQLQSPLLLLLFFAAGASPF